MLGQYADYFKAVNAESTSWIHCQEAESISINTSYNSPAIEIEGSISSNSYNLSSWSYISKFVVEKLLTLEFYIHVVTSWSIIFGEQVINNAVRKYYPT